MKRSKSGLYDDAAGVVWTSPRVCGLFCGCLLRHGFNLCAPDSALFQVWYFCKRLTAIGPCVQASNCKWSKIAGLGDNPGVLMPTFKKKWRSVNLYPLPFIVNKQWLRFSFRITEATPCKFHLNQLGTLAAMMKFCNNIYNSDFCLNKFSLKWTEKYT